MMRNTLPPLASNDLFDAGLNYSKLITATSLAEAVVLV
jgi:hypothetical protein